MPTDSWSPAFVWYYLAIKHESYQCLHLRVYCSRYGILIMSLMASIALAFYFTFPRADMSPLVDFRAITCHTIAQNNQPLTHCSQPRPLRAYPPRPISERHT